MAEVQDVFSSSFNAYRDNHFVSLQGQKVANAIMACRTASLGGHVDACPSCDYSRPSYNSLSQQALPEVPDGKEGAMVDKQAQAGLA